LQQEFDGGVSKDAQFPCYSSFQTVLLKTEESVRLVEEILHA
jgi:hypothetical protein